METGKVRLLISIPESPAALWKRDLSASTSALLDTPRTRPKAAHAILFLSSAFPQGVGRRTGLPSQRLD